MKQKVSETKRSNDLSKKTNNVEENKKKQKFCALFQMNKRNFGQEKLSEKQKKKFLSKVLFLSKDLI